ncbi:hypothetical protein Asppvi_008237 [Aspergillus pseudoviridinutans]|uniref:NWD NACHT-NTPase N-terminal domain-containing protein n=1 Tax=Aspergillus pseudoviridinutans TaxID=1517512 RepID=A0A9P3BE09_9EURO|nr:uncharacterized protein Asppvi_008237 [Aspergillus pseudoviridinutans]GIJ89300.1 hypothetical protein Asppvi_008237 [Aspergillus pseudoviridinutans]
MRSLRFIKKLRRDHSEKRSVHKSRSGDGLSKPESLATALQGSQQETDDLWLKAELLLKKDEKTSKILAAATEILEADFHFQVPSNALIARDQICSFLNAQARELEEKKWVVTLGGHSIKVADQLTRTFRNVLIIKDVINTAATASPPAAIACAGVMVGLLLIVQAVEQHENLLRGLETTSALIPRLHLIEDLYLHPNVEVTAQLRKEFSETLTLLYSKVIEFQARAICYLQKHSVSRLFRNMFKQDRWSNLLQDMQRLETNTQSFASIIEPTVVREKLNNIEKAFSKNQIWRTTSTQDEKVKQFFKLLYTCPYRDRKDRNSKRVPGTCEWFTNHTLFHKWEHSDQSGLLWATADPGCRNHPKAGEIIYALDALDECQEDDQKQLIQALKSLYSERPKKHNLKFLVTSRPYDHIRRGFQELEDKVPTIHLSGEGEVETQEISREINLIIKKRVADISKQDNLPPDECLYLQQQLTSVLNWMYLWVSLTLDVIENMSGFMKGNIRQTDKARKLLHIITAAERPLSLWELALAMAFSAGHVSMPDIWDELEEDDKKFERSIRALCGLFLVVMDGKVYLLHQTAKEFLVGSSQLAQLSPNDSLQTNTWKHCLKSEESHKILAHTCMSYLTLVHDTTADSLHYFLEYAACNWPSHFRRAFAQYEHEAAELGYKLCRSGSEVYESWSKEYKKSHARGYEFPGDPTALLIASYLGLTAVVKLLLDTERVYVDFRDSVFGWTPLLWAAGNGHEAVVKLLLDTGKVDVNSKDSKYDWTPLSLAAENGHEAVVKLLLDTDEVDVDSIDSDGRTPLSLAAERGHEAVVKLLLDTGMVDVDSRDSEYDWTPLSLAAERGHEAVVKLLLDTDEVDVDSIDSDGWTPLALAAESGHDAVIKLLLDTGKVDVDYRDSDGQTPLSWAAWNGHEAVVKLLLDTKKVDVNSRDSDGQTPLSLAAERGHDAVIKLLLDTGKVDVNSRDSDGQTPLSWATKNGQEAIATS